MPRSTDSSSRPSTPAPTSRVEAWLITTLCILLAASSWIANAKASRRSIVSGTRHVRRGFVASNVAAACSRLLGLLVSLPVVRGSHEGQSASGLAGALAEWCANPTSTEAARGPVSTWDTSSTTDMSNLLYNAPCKSTFNEDIDGWNVASVTNMGYMFGVTSPPVTPHVAPRARPARTRSHPLPPQGASSFNQALNWNVVSVTYMDSLFYGATSFNQPLPWNVAGLTSLISLFYVRGPHCAHPFHLTPRF